MEMKNKKQSQARQQRNKKKEDALVLEQKTKEQDEKLNKLITTYVIGAKCKKPVGKTFPHKLMEVINKDIMGEVITWKPHGRAFIVIDRKKYVEKVLCIVFEMTLFDSFTRQLNTWGFKRITQGQDAGAYYHELFLRGRQDLIRFMFRQKIKGTGTRLLCNPEQEPDFYNMTALKPFTSHNNTTSIISNQNVTFNYSPNIPFNAFSSTASLSRIGEHSSHYFLHDQFSTNHPQINIPILTAAGNVPITQSMLFDIQFKSYILALLNQKTSSLLFRLHQSLLYQKVLEYYIAKKNSFNPISFELPL